MALCAVFIIVSAFNVSASEAVASSLAATETMQCVLISVQLLWPCTFCVSGLLTASSKRIALQRTAPWVIRFQPLMTVKEQVLLCSGWYSKSSSLVQGKVTAQLQQFYIWTLCETSARKQLHHILLFHFILSLYRGKNIIKSQFLNYSQTMWHLKEENDLSWNHISSKTSNMLHNTCSSTCFSAIYPSARPSYEQHIAKNLEGTSSHLPQKFILDILTDCNL